MNFSVVAFSPHQENFNHLKSRLPLEV
uniref:Uncharacterized protein n=1 Tax=Rhizophora mucronata TaxID=61149 RepID=A0A2P2Q0M9_RHIMU